MVHRIDAFFQRFDTIGLPAGDPEAALDRWTPVHIAFGAGFGLIGVNRPVAYGLMIATEIFEAVARSRGSTFFKESNANMIADLVVGIAAYELARGLR